MKKATATIGSLFALWAALSIFPTVAQTPQFPQQLPPNSVLGRMGIVAGPAQAIPFGTLAAQLGVTIPSASLSLPVADVRNFGVASCAGSTDASTAVGNAISAGFFRVFLPAGCLYQPPTNSGSETIPSSITIIGQNGDPNLGNVSLVRTANRATGSDFLQLGSRAALQNVAIQSNFCDQQTVPTATQKLCPLGIGYNNGDQAATVTNWPYEQIFYTSGTTTTQPGGIVANDSPLTAFLMNNLGDGIYVATTGGGVGVRAQTGGTAGDKAFLVQNGSISSPANVHTGFQCTEVGANASSSCFLAERLNNGSAPMIVRQDDGPSTTTTAWDQWVVQFQTAGNIRNTFQTTTPFSGAFDFINAGNGGGTFTGQFVNYQIAGVTKFQVDPNGIFNVGGVSAGTPKSVCGGGTYTQLSTDYSLIVTAACTITLLNPTTFPGRILNIKTLAGAVTSASANVQPRAGGANATAILANAAGNWATLQSDSGSWILMAGTP